MVRTNHTLPTKCSNIIEIHCSTLYSLCSCTYVCTLSCMCRWVPPILPGDEGREGTWSVPQEQQWHGRGAGRHLTHIQGHRRLVNSVAPVCISIITMAPVCISHYHYGSSMYLPLSLWLQCVSPIITMAPVCISHYHYGSSIPIYLPIRPLQYILIISTRVVCMLCSAM